MSSTRKKKPTNPKARKEAHPRLAWPPEEWPEEIRQAQIEAAQAGFSEFLADVAASFSPFPKPAEIIPFNRSKK